MIATMESMGALGADALEPGFLDGLAALGDALRRMPRPDRSAVRRLIVEQSAPGIARMLARDLSRNPHARRAVVAAYLTSPDPVAEYRDVAAFDYMTALATALPDAYNVYFESDEEEPGDLASLLSGLIADLAFLGKKKKWYKKLKPKKILKVLAGAAAVAGVVALGVATGGAALPLVATAASTGAQIAMQKKAAKAAKKEERRLAAEMAAESAYPPPGEAAQTVQAATEAVSSTMQDAGRPVEAGAAEATGQLVAQVVPQAMASYAASQVAGKTPAQVAAETGVRPEDINPQRLKEAPAVAQGAAPTSEIPVWVLPAAVGGGGLLLALATGVI